MPSASAEPRFIAVPQEDWPSGITRWKFDRTDGEHSPSSKITNAQAVWLVSCYVAGVEMDSLGAMLGISKVTVRGILTGERYTEATVAARRPLRQRRFKILNKWPGAESVETE